MDPKAAVIIIGIGLAVIGGSKVVHVVKKDVVTPVAHVFHHPKAK